MTLFLTIFPHVVAQKNSCAVRCTLVLTKSHGTVSQVINGRKTKWNETNDFKSSTIFTKLQVFFGSGKIFKEKVRFNP